MSDDEARRLFGYVGGDEWRDYRAIMGVFAGTFFAELTPDEVSTRLGAAGHPLDPELLADRLDRLQQWGTSRSRRPWAARRAWPTTTAVGTTT